LYLAYSSPPRLRVNFEGIPGQRSPQLNLLPAPLCSLFALLFPPVRLSLSSSPSFVRLCAFSRARFLLVPSLPVVSLLSLALGVGSCARSEKRNSPASPRLTGIKVEVILLARLDTYLPHLSTVVADWRTNEQNSPNWKPRAEISNYSRG
jgi:hypothetical protein